MSGEAKTVEWFAVPAGTPSAECAGCRQTIYWIVTEAGRRMPVNCDVPGGLRPVRFVGGGGRERRHKHHELLVAVMKDNGCGISHFFDCPEAGSFRRKA